MSTETRPETRPAGPPVPRSRVSRLLFRRLVVLTAPKPAAARPAVPRRAKAVAALAWGAAAFLAATAALSAAVETVFVQARDPEYGERLVRFRALRAAHPDRPVVPVLGTSRTQNSIDPRSMGFPDEPGAPLVFNFGHSGIRPLHLRLALWRLHEEGIRPAAVLVELFPGYLGIVEPLDTAFREADQLTAADVRWLAPHLDDPGALRRRWARTRCEPWSAHRNLLVNWCAPELLPAALRRDYVWTALDPHGFHPFPTGAVTEAWRERRLEQMRRAYGVALADLRVAPAAAEAHRALVADCRERGIPVAFFLAPESPAFRGWYAPGSRAAVDGLVRELRDELGCPVFDAPIDYAEEDFADGHHALHPTAARFSRDLADKHLKPWLAGVLK